MLGIVVIIILSIIASGGLGYMLLTQAKQRDIAAKKLVEAEKDKEDKLRIVKNTEYQKHFSDVKAKVTAVISKPVDCKLSDWSEWTKCSVECGGGVQTRSRTLISPAKNGGKCGPLTETRECNIQPCPKDCQVSDWNEWTSCTAPCGGGKQTRTRTVIQPSVGDGKACPSLVEAKECNTNKCPVDCKVGEWSAWSACDKECGSGTQFRTRRILQEAANAGQECPALKETRACNTQLCIKDCEVGQWSEWSACTKTCGGGTRMRNRVVNTPATNGGKECPALTETETCNTQACPIDCEVSTWTEWNSCSKPCGGGVQTRTRTVTKPSAYGGKECPLLKETKPCNEQSCQVPPSAINCEVSAWSNWGGCSKTCGGGTQKRTRTVTKPAANGGAACPVLEESQTCNTLACPVDCVTSDWGAWDTCSKTCGGGTQTRTKTVKTPAANGGKDCGPLVETKVCNEAACPVDCVSSWGDWNSCSKPCGGGTQTRTLKVTQEAVNKGTPCPTVREESKVCNTQACPPPGSVVSTNGRCGPGNGDTRCSDGQCCSTEGWCGSDYNFCSSKAFRRSDTTYHGTNAPTSASFDKVDCQVQWTDWSRCTETCGDQKSVRTGTVTQQPANGGAACPTSLREEKSCGLPACPPVNCQVRWDDVLPCSKTCGAGTKLQVATVTQYPNSTGTPCPTTLSRYVACNTQACPVNCDYTWGAWSGCSASCGGGTRSRDPIITTQAANGGTACPTKQTENCNTQACPTPVNCISLWSDWGACSASCGGGTQKRTLTVLQEAANGGKACPAREESKSCNTQACPAPAPAPATNNVWNQVPGKLKQVSHSGNTVCGVNSDDNVFCTNFGSSSWGQLPGKLKQISVDGTKACGTDASDKVFCMDDVFWFNPSWTSVAGGIRQIDVSGSKMCGVDASGALFCADYKKNNWAPKTGNFKQVSITGNKLCGTNSADDIFCADDFTISNPAWQKLGGQLRQVDIDGNQMCGVTGAGSVYCAPYKSSDWKQKAGIKKHISTGSDGKAYAVTSSDDVFYTNAIA